MSSSESPGAVLEITCIGNPGTQGSNPRLSATFLESAPVVLLVRPSRTLRARLQAYRVVACDGEGRGSRPNAWRLAATDALVEYALKLDSSLTVARVGFFLDRHRDALMVEERHLATLRKRAPRQPAYLDRKREPGKLVPGWNLVVPERVLTRSWGAVA